MLIGTINQEARINAVNRCREKGVIIPTFRQLMHPETIPESIKNSLKNIDINEVHPLNLFRITWKNDVKTKGFGKVNFIEIPREITGVKARIFGLVGKHFPTGAHKVGAAFACLIPRLVSGQFDPIKHKAVWPSTGNYCRGGAFDSALLGCNAVAILPERMSSERFEWLHSIGAEVIKTHGCESNVKEIYDKCKELQADPNNIILNQFAEFGNSIFHYHVTGSAIKEAFESLDIKGKRLSAYVSATGSAGTIAAGDRIKHDFPGSKVIATEAKQCPTLLNNGFGDHRIEGIGDKHVPWIHNVRNTDVISAIDDEDCMRILQLFNEPEGKAYLLKKGVSESSIESLGLLGISGICNLLSAIKAAKYFEMDENDVIFTIFTDSVEMYKSRVSEMRESRGVYNELFAAQDFSACIAHQGIDYFKEFTYYDRKAIHNLKYFTWVEQQGKTVEEINQLWNPEFWRNLFDNDIVELERMIEEFNKDVGIV